MGSRSAPRLAALPAGVRWRPVHGVGWLGGIGFTMSLFVAGLAFSEAPALLTEAKLGVLIASIAAGLCGWFLLLLAPGDDGAIKKRRRPEGRQPHPRGENRGQEPIDGCGR